VTADGKFSWVEVECLGACVNAPMAQINYDFYEDLTPESFVHILDELAAGREPQPGPQIERQLSAPVGGPTTLTDPALYPAAKKKEKAGSSTRARPAQGTTDDEAKKPGVAASRREEPAPKAPEGDAGLEQQSGTRRE
jgi:NADH-quinone oxidoreductase subunit E